MWARLDDKGCDVLEVDTLVTGVDVLGPEARDELTVVALLYGVTGAREGRKVLGATLTLPDVVFNADGLEWLEA